MYVPVCRLLIRTEMSSSGKRGDKLRTPCPWLSERTDKARLWRV
jgi:hypothetical protein